MDAFKFQSHVKFFCLKQKESVGGDSFINNISPNLLSYTSFVTAKSAHFINAEEYPFTSMDSHHLIFKNVNTWLWSHLP